MYFQAFKQTITVEVSGANMLEIMLTQPDSLDSKMDFIPITAIHKLINDQSVLEYCEEFSEMRSHVQPSDVVKYVCGQPEARCVFAVIILIDEPRLLRDLMGEKVCDNDLPLSHLEADGVEFQLARNSRPTSPVECFRKWKPAQRHYFDEFQRRVKAEVLGRRPISLPVTQFPDRSVLPFTRRKTIHYKVSSRVDRVEIHHAHHRFNNGPEV